MIRSTLVLAACILSMGCAAETSEEISETGDALEQKIEQEQPIPIPWKAASTHGGIQSQPIPIPWKIDIGVSPVAEKEAAGSSSRD